MVCKAGFREERWEAKGNNFLSTGKQKFAGSEKNPRMQERVPGNWGEGWSWAVWSQCWACREIQPMRMSSTGDRLFITIIGKF